MAIRAAGPVIYGMVGDFAQSRLERAHVDNKQAELSGNAEGMQRAQQEMNVWSEGGAGKLAVRLVECWPICRV